MDIKREIEISSKVISKLKSEAEKIEEAGRLVADVLKEGGKVLIFGNGGSASDAQHMTAELVGGYRKKRRGLSAVALTTDVASLTAISNDFSFEEVFKRQIEALGRRGDVVIGISTSGRSKNVIKALARAKEMGICTIGITGQGGGDMHSVCDVLIKAPSDDTQRIQETHTLILHLICGIVEECAG